MRLIRSVLFSVAVSCVVADDTGEWIDYAVEGKIAKMDAELAPTLREGMVFSAVYGVAPEMDAVDLDEAVSRARYFDVVGNIEASIDVNYILVYEAETGIGDRSVELTRVGGDIEAEQDLYTILLPLEAEPIGEEGWAARWLQMWFYGEAGEMLSSVDLQAPPEEFSSGWWRLTFWNADGSRSVLAEGMIEAAGEAGAPLSPSEQIAQLEGVVVRLNDELDSQLAANASLRSELDEARTRIVGLQKIVDVIVEERRILQDKYDLLKAEEVPSDAELLAKVSTLEADLMLREEKELEWEMENQALGDALVKAEEDYAQLVKELTALEGELKAEEPEPVLAPIVIEVEPEDVVVVETPLVADVEAVVPEEIPAAKEEKRSVFRRPGKFRR